MNSHDVNIVPATLEHAELLAGIMRAEDVAEVEAIGGTPREMLHKGVRDSEISFSAFRGLELGAMFGVYLVDGGLAALWSLTGPAFGRYPVAFCRASRFVVSMLLELYPELVNVVDARYSAAVRFVRFLGAELLEPVPLGPAGQAFYPFRFRRH